MRPLAIIGSVAVSIFGMNYAMCGPDGPDNPSSILLCSRGADRNDAALPAVAGLRAGCPADDTPLDIDILLPRTTTGQLLVHMRSKVWVTIPVVPEGEHCVAVDLEIPFSDGSRRWLAFEEAFVDRVPASDGFCVTLAYYQVADQPALGPTTVRIRVVGATFAGEAELPAVIRN